MNHHSNVRKASHGLVAAVAAPARERLALDRKADARTRTWDPIITSDVLYQLSYVGEGPEV